MKSKPQPTANTLRARQWQAMEARILGAPYRSYRPCDTAENRLKAMLTSKQ